MANNKADRDFFRDFLGKSRKQVKAEYNGIVEENKYAKIVDWKTQQAEKIVDFYKWLMKLGYPHNSARAFAWQVVTYFRKNITKIELRRGSIPRAQKGAKKHAFTDEELSRLYAIGNPLEKIMLGTGFEWGLRIGDLCKMKREIVAENFEVLTTKRKIIAHLSSTDALLEDIEMAKAFWKGKDMKYLFPNKNHGHLSDDFFNDTLRDLMKRAMIENDGIIQWHCLRDWLWTKMKDLGIPEDERAYYIGKSGKIDHDTYSDHWKKWYPKLEKVFNDIRLRKPVMNETQYYKAINWIVKRLKAQGIDLGEPPFSPLSKWLARQYDFFRKEPVDPDEARLRDWSDYTDEQLRDWSLIWSGIKAREEV